MGVPQPQLKQPADASVTDSTLPIAAAAIDIRTGRPSILRSLLLAPRRRKPFGACAPMSTPPVAGRIGKPHLCRDGECGCRGAMITGGGLNGGYSVTGRVVSDSVDHERVKLVEGRGRRCAGGSTSWRP